MRTWVGTGRSVIIAGLLSGPKEGNLGNKPLYFPSLVAGREVGSGKLLLMLSENTLDV